ncbi:MAG: acyl carrier protein [Isosphaeraceae bacterium]|nr:acyl carrier protein [Isosphaeraceae bacterium]
MIGYPLEARSIRAHAERLRQRLASRSSVSSAEFAAACARDVPPEVAERIRRVLAKVGEEAVQSASLRIDPAIIQPDDDLGDGLGFCLDSLAFCEMLIELEKEFGMRFRYSEFKRLSGKPVWS